MQNTYESSLRALRRVPDDIILAVASRDFAMRNSSQCVCGRIVRELIGKVADVAATKVKLGFTTHPLIVRQVIPDAAKYDDSADLCQKAFGGSRQDWVAVYWGVTDPGYELPEVERAFTVRVMEAAGVK